MGLNKTIQKVKVRKDQRKEAQEKMVKKENMHQNNIQEKKPQKPSFVLINAERQKPSFDLTNEERQKMLDDYLQKEEEEAKTRAIEKDYEKCEKIPSQEQKPVWDVFQNPIYTGRLPDKIVIEGRILELDLDRNIERGRKRVIEHYNMMCQEDDGLNPGLAERIRDEGFKDLKRYRIQMELINWREFFKDVVIPWPTETTVVTPGSFSDEERDSRLCGP